VSQGRPPCGITAYFLLLLPDYATQGKPWSTDGMTRRRLIVAIVAAVLCGMAWWLSLDRLSAEERLLVGTWNFDGKLGTRRPSARYDARRLRYRSPAN